MVLLPLKAVEAITMGRVFTIRSDGNASVGGPHPLPAFHFRSVLFPAGPSNSHYRAEIRIYGMVDIRTALIMRRWQIAAFYAIVAGD